MGVPHALAALLMTAPAVLLGACAQHAPPPRPSVATASCAQAVLAIDGNKIWVDAEGAGEVTVAFEAGFGNDSTVWATLAPKIRAGGARTFVYDRAGMGKSTIDTTAPYSIDNDVHILTSALTRCGIAGPIVLVGHSYGGGMSLVAASQDPRIRGVVLLDAMAPNVWPQEEVERNLVTMRAQYDEIRAQAPELAKVAIPWAEALPDTVKRIDAVRLPPTLPIIDIVAENGRDNAVSAKLWRDAHIGFTANNRYREYILAAGSSHKVMVDKLELVVDSILRMLARLRIPA